MHVYILIKVIFLCSF